MAQRKLTFEFTGPKEIVDETFELCAQYLWDKGYGIHYDADDAPILFDDLKEKDKDDIISSHLGQVILDCAHTQDSMSGQVIARDEANERAKERKWDA